MAVDQDKRIVRTMGLGVQAPVIKVGKEFDPVVEQSAEISQHEPKDRISGRRDARKWRGGTPDQHHWWC